MKRSHTDVQQSKDQQLTSKQKTSPRRAGHIAIALQSKEYLSTLTQEAMAYAVVHGVIVAKASINTNDGGGGAQLVVHAPLALLPFELDASAFYQAQNMCPLFNKLVDQISRNPSFLLEQLSGVAGADQFTGRLVKLLEKIVREDGGEKQKIHLNVNRSDYMIHNYEDEKTHRRVQIPQQVELNTIAASFAALSTKISLMHKFFLDRYVGNAELSSLNLPENNCVQEIAAGIAHAVQLHHASNPVVVCIVLPGETNIADQRMLEYTLWENHHVLMIRRTLLDMHSRAQVSQEGNLTIDGQNVALVYFRAGYDPRHYSSDKEWEALEKMERSMAIKCPCVASHLAGCKKIQQLMALPGVLEKFLSEQEAADLRSCFTGLWGLERDDDETKAVIADAIAHPENYVLKPQREGGGNNLWNKEMTEKLSTATVAERSAFILMQRIKPRPAISPMMREGAVTVTDCLSELGIFGVLVSDDKQEYRNKLCGHLLRTKQEGVDEGGVAAGFAVLSSPLLTDPAADS